LFFFGPLLFFLFEFCFLEVTIDYWFTSREKIRTSSKHVKCFKRVFWWIETCYCKSLIINAAVFHSHQFRLIYFLITHIFLKGIPMVYF
jgi:hypothetical protein